VIGSVGRSVWAAPRAVGAPGPSRRDWALVGVLVTVAVLEGLLRPDVAWRPLVVLEAAGLAFTLPWRRTHPLGVVAAGFGAVILLDAAAVVLNGRGQVGLDSMLYLLLLPYALYRWGSGREVVAGSAIALGAYGESVLREVTQLSDAVGGFVVLTLPAVLGLLVRNWSTSRARELDTMRARERELLARELHDTVAHHVSAMVIRAQAGRVVAATRPLAAVEALELIETEGSRTLAEMRAMVTALRDTDDAELTPVRGIADIERLGTSADGPTVRVTSSGVPDGVSPAVEAALYRIAQEAVTNALRHARQAQQICVDVRGQDGLVRLTVTDDGEPVPAARLGTGYGIVGMTERAKLLGGTLTAGAGEDRGWVVDAALPASGAGR
jgi:signal transduction histidine kinase